METGLKLSLWIGFKKGLQSSLGIIKVMLPVTLAVTVLKISPLLGWVSEICKPLMGLVGLRGEAALPFILGALLNLYMAIGAMIPLGLTPKETTILATMLLISHNLFVETAIIRGMDAPWVWLLLLRILAAFFMGFILSWIL
jgi:spore maturation protein SpmB